MNKLQNNINYLFVENYRKGLQAKQILNYLNKDNYLLPEIKINYLDDFQSYKYELFNFIKNLNYYYNNKNSDKILIIPIYTAKLPFPKKEILKKLFLSFGDEFFISQFVEQLKNWGYSLVDMVKDLGEFSLNSQIIDIFPINSNSPYRISFKDNLIQSIKKFDISSQISNSDEVEIIEIFSIFGLNQEQYNSIMETIKFEIKEGLTLSLISYGLWFLDNLSEKIEIQESLIFKNLPIYKESLNIDFKQIDSQEQQHFTKSSIILDEIQKGEYVVHVDYGIGIFESIEQNYVLGAIKDFLKIKYQGDNYLLLPVENLNLISRYISGTGKAPIIDKLGKGGFSKVKKDIQKKLFLIAQNIIKLSAERKLIKSPIIKSLDLTNFQKSANFIYTQDQKKAIQNILDNLQKSYPMEHLLIGDVGFGKTEVALNIIKTVVNSNLQVAFIVPTALLAKQHYETAKNRLPDIKIAHVDRFLKLPEKRKIIKLVKNGEIDLIIGTHSIFNFQYKNLGLVIIDEEHRFGVKQKNQLQEMYIESHYLSMSATPIPRTLHQALSSLKTFSTIETPPKNRKPIRTFVKEYNRTLIKNVIINELNRGGQIFYIFNSINLIEQQKIELNNLFPKDKLKILVLHSKIPSKIMESEIINFVNKKYNLLLATSIIGAGLHIPNVNTILIHSSDRFGIADLHQFRGRVGRGDIEGQCYFLIENFNKITENSKKRLLALQESSELGSGITLAQHDLEIRGGGNLIGEAQSGHIDKIGYSLYIQLLENEILKQTNQTINKKNSEIQLSVSAYLSSKLIKDERVKIDLYRRASLVTSLDEIKQLKSETINRFGKLDTSSNQFFQIIQIKFLANLLNIKIIKNFKKNITITFFDNNKISIEAETQDEDDLLNATLKFLLKYRKKMG